MPELRLPPIPKDCYYEDYVAAFLNASGYYLDRSVHRKRNGLDLLELDVVATKFESTGVKKTIIEVKSGGWGIKDLFKINGWLHYLKLSNAAFVYQEAPEGKDEETMQSVARELGINLLSNPLKPDGTIDNTALISAFDIKTETIHPAVLRALRYSYDLERVMLDYIHAFCKESPQYKTPPRVYNYFRSLVDKSFFIYDPITRLAYLTDLSMDHKNIACVLDKEIKGLGVLPPEECTQFAKLYEIENPTKMELRPVDVALHVQLLSRLFVLKSMVEYLVQPEEGNKTQYESLVDRLRLLGLSSNISMGIDSLKTHSQFYLYPFFFQVFFFVFGGFIMKDQETKEYEYLSRLTGLSKEAIGQALSFWDELFPLSKSWMKTINHGGLYYMQFVPVPLRGIGFNFRRFYYAPPGMTDSQALFDNLKSLVSTNSYNDMVHWNNVAWAMLNQDRNLHQLAAKPDSKFDKHLLSIENYIQSKHYRNVQSFSDYLKDKKCPNFNVNGFYCEESDSCYDLYIVKADNKLIKFPINQVIQILNLNQSFMRHCYVMGTDEHKIKNDNDTIWFTCSVPNAEISCLVPVVDEALKLFNC